MAGFVNIGFGNIVNSDKVESIVSPDSAPSKRMIQRAKEDGSVIDATQGRRTKAIIVMDNASLVLSALQPETIAGRLNQVGEA
jgi:hypothetical protein